MKPLRLIPAVLAAAVVVLFAQTDIDVGTGAPSETIRQRFQIAFFRNGFHLLVKLPPAGRVRNFGSLGLVQEFSSTASTNNNQITLALVRPNRSDVVAEDAIDVFQVLAPMYSYYSSIGPNTAGYPTVDTQPCAAVSNSSCQYQTFDKNYALFVYFDGDLGNQNFTTRDPFYSKWLAAGGINGVGSAVQAEESVTSGAGTGATATWQRFSGGAIYNITSGLQNTRQFVVKSPIYNLYSESNRHTGFLGFPISEELTLSNGRRRQSFEGGSIEYQPGSTPILLLPVGTVAVNPSSSLQNLKLGDTVTLTASLFAANGSVLEGRPISWATTNNRVVSIEPLSGPVVTLRAVGGGSASITAVSEGKTSRALIAFVAAPCCQVGEGSPTASIQQAFQDAVTRNRLNLKLPGPSPARRLGNGYVQEVESAAGNPPVRYLLAKPDAAASAFVVAHSILARYLELGGPAGSLGYPLGDASAGGRQLFENGALAGNPVYLVSGMILSRWAAQGYENGPAGLPAGNAEPYLTFAATAGTAQVFRGGAIYAGATAPHANRAYLVSGLIYDRYLSVGGVNGPFGMPASEEFSANGKRRQEFEGGHIEYAPGDTTAEAVERERVPQISATPSTVVAGSILRIAAGGFPNGATLRITVGSQPEFTVSTQSGSYAWEQYIPSSTPAGLVNLRAVEVGGKAIAAGSFLVDASSEALLRLTKLSGDTQVGLPGARLAQPLRVRLTDEAGNPMSGMPVRFETSPGSLIEDASTVTDEAGQAQGWLRLPLSESPALATVSAGRQVVTFSARAAASTLTNFPRQMQEGVAPLGRGRATIGEKGALLAAASSILRHMQNLGEAPSSNGQAEPATLNQFLTQFCGLSSSGTEICDGFLEAPGSGEPVVNLWRLGAFAGTTIDVVPQRAAPEAIRDLLARNTPVLIGLSLQAGGMPAGSHFVVAIGVSADGSIVIHDPNPRLARSRLEDYTTGFSSGGRNWTGVVNSVVRLAVSSAPQGGFLLLSNAARLEVSSPEGACGANLTWPEMASNGQDPLALPPGEFRLRFCDGRQGPYQLDIGGGGSLTAILTDLAWPGNRESLSVSGAAAFRVHRPAANWSASAQQTAVSGVVNAASFTPAIAPGSLIAIFGNGLASEGQAPLVEIGGLPAAVVSWTPFQVNAQVPLELPPGTFRLRLQSIYGTAAVEVTVSPSAPALFVLPGNRAAALNQDGSINGIRNPARRGQVLVLYATGLGAVAEQGGLQVAVSPVKVMLGAEELPVMFAGLAPGFTGLYQVNVLLPPSTPPGLARSILLKQDGVGGNEAWVAVQ